VYNISHDVVKLFNWYLNVNEQSKSIDVNLRLSLFYKPGPSGVTIMPDLHASAKVHFPH
jgi:hypothetical protein